MNQSSSDGKVTCSNCYHEVPNLQVCETCGAELGAAAPSSSSSTGGWQPFGAPPQTPPGPPLRIWTAFPSPSPNNVSPTPPQPGWSSGQWQPMPPPPSSAAPASPTETPLAWRPPDPLTANKNSTPNSVIDQFLAQQSTVNQSNKAMLYVFVAFALLSSLLAFCQLARVM